MSTQYRIYGSDLSPYSVKVRSYFRYKEIPHRWLDRSGENGVEYQKYARLPIVPLVVTPEDEGIQDSTPIIEVMEAKVAEPSIHPSDPTLRFLSELIEEFGDEWGNKWMFHFRWAREVDQIQTATRLVGEMMKGASAEEQAPMIAQIKERMSSRLGVVGSNATTGPMIEASFKEGLLLLDEHLATRLYLFGARPSLADFGLAAQIQNAGTDPTASEIMQSTAPNVCAWSDRILNPSAEGDFETWESLAPTLMPLLKGPVRSFLIWSDANSKAIASGAGEMSVELDAGAWTQSVGGPQKYHAKSLKEIRRKYDVIQDISPLAKILEDAGCREWLIA